MCFLHQSKQVRCSTSPPKPLLTGQTITESSRTEQKVDIEGSYFQTLQDSLEENQNQQTEDESAMPESLHLDRKMIWKHKLSSSEITTLNTKLSEILDRGLTLREKVLQPFWNQQSKEISKKLLLPTEIGSVDSVLSCSNASYGIAPMGKSWFSIKKKHLQRKNSPTTSSQSSPFSLHDYMDLEAIQSKNKSNEQQKLKTLKIRIFPTNDQKNQLKIMFEQYKWYYNSLITMFYQHFNFTDSEVYSNYKFSYPFIRDSILNKYRYTEDVDIDKGIALVDFVYNENQNTPHKPDFFPEAHSRIPRGAAFKFTGNINSCLANKRAGNTDSFGIGFMKKKKDPYVYFEDSKFPAFIKSIDSKYWYKDKNKRNRSILSFKDIFNSTQKRGLQVSHDKLEDKYYIYYTVDYDWFPENDKRIDIQGRYSSKGTRIISLDPGIRKFLVGYDPENSIITVADNENIKIVNLLAEIDHLNSLGKPTKCLWRKIQNIVDELHWKSINFLVSNYDCIICPTFPIKQMVKSRKISKETKRLMYMFSFYRFKTKLKFKCDMYGKTVFFVDESYTSKTCCRCGHLTDVKGAEIYTCKKCKLVIDRDYNGTINILIKFLTELYAGANL